MAPKARRKVVGATSALLVPADDLTHAYGRRAGCWCEVRVRPDDFPDWPELVIADADNPVFGDLPELVRLADVAARRNQPVIVVAAFNEHPALSPLRDRPGLHSRRNIAGVFRAPRPATAPARPPRRSASPAEGPLLA